MTIDQAVPFILIPGFTIVLILIYIVWNKVNDNEKTATELVGDADQKLTKISAELYERISKIESNSIPNIEKSIIRLEAKVETLLDNVSEINLNLKTTTSALNDLRETLISLKYQTIGKLKNE